MIDIDGHKNGQDINFSVQEDKAIHRRSNFKSPVSFYLTYSTCFILFHFDLIYDRTQ